MASYNPRRTLRTALDASPEAIQSFRALVRPQPNGCHEWMGPRHPSKGYGTVPMDGVLRRAHRVAYELGCGPIPAGLMVCHKCDNPPCCNPDHLFVGTASDNIADCMAKHRKDRVTVASFVPRVCGNGHELTNENMRFDEYGRFIQCIRCFESGRASRVA